MTAMLQWSQVRLLSAKFYYCLRAQKILAKADANVLKSPFTDMQAP
jgi:hypothetical protein